MSGVNEERLEALGLTFPIMQSTQGSVTVEKFSEVIDMLADEGESVATKKQGLSILSALCAMAPAQVPLEGYADALLQNVIEKIVTMPDDPAADGESYEGQQTVAEGLATALGTLCTMDQTGARTIMMMPKAYAVVDRVLDAELSLIAPSGFVREGPAVSRFNTVRSLLGICPYQGKVDAPQVPVTLIRIVKNGPPALAADAKSKFSILSMIMSGPFRGHAGELLELIEMGGHDDLVHTFTSDPELYASDPEGVHAHVEVFLNMPFTHTSSILYAISGKAPQVLVPYTDKMLHFLRTESQMALMAVNILKGMSRVAGPALYPHLDEIADKAKNAQGGLPMLAGIFAGVGTQSTEIADEMVGRLGDMLSWNLPADAAPSVLHEMTNLKDSVSSNEVYGPYMDKIREYKSSAETMVTMLEDIYAGRSLEIVTDRLDTLEERINELNNKVAESCSNFEEVKAYVDANIAEVKDFVGEIAKKLPTPHRLEVTGRIRKTLILHFQCGRSGREYPIESKEWNKWLKVGFTLIQTAQCVIDIGTGNLLDLASTGVDMVKDVYDIYKSADDDEFNSYIQNPFLLSSEQDRLLEKLRDQGFFDVMDYDAQLGAWFLLHPERDGKLPPDALAAANVSADADGKISAEQMAVAEAKAREGALANTSAGKAAGARQARQEDESGLEMKGSAGPSSSSSRVAAARDAGATKEANKDIDALRRSVQELERRVQELENRPAGGGCCTVS